MIKEFCDRCGKTIPQRCFIEKFPYSSIKIELGLLSAREMELCTDCTKELMKVFLEKGKKIEW